MIFFVYYLHLSYIHQSYKLALTICHPYNWHHEKGLACPSGHYSAELKDGRLDRHGFSHEKWWLRHQTW